MITEHLLLQRYKALKITRKYLSTTARKRLNALVRFQCINIYRMQHTVLLNATTLTKWAAAIVDFFNKVNEQITFLLATP